MASPIKRIKEINQRINTLHWESRTLTHEKRQLEKELKIKAFEARKNRARRILELEDYVVLGLKSRCVFLKSPEAKHILRFAEEAEFTNALLKRLLAAWQSSRTLKVTITDSDDRKTLAPFPDYMPSEYQLQGAGGCGVSLSEKDLEKLDKWLKESPAGGLEK